MLYCSSSRLTSAVEVAPQRLKERSAIGPCVCIDRAAVLIAAARASRTVRMSEQGKGREGEHADAPVSYVLTDIRIKLSAITHSIAVPAEIVAAVEIPRRPSAGAG